jgi:uncharacterized membrane protein
MASDEPGFGPLQLLVVGFETTELLQGQIAREIAELRGRGLVRVVDARMFTRSEDGELGEVDLNPLLGDPRWRPAAHLFGLNGAATNGGSGGLDAAAFAATAGFTLEDLRRLTDEIHHGEHAAVVLVEHLWAGRLREKIRAAGGRLIAQGMLTQEVLMLVGAELQATADAEAAIDLAEAARGAALLDALHTLTAGTPDPDLAARERASAACAVVRTLVDAGVIAPREAGEAVEALAKAGIVEQALLDGAVAETQDLMDKLDEAEEPPERE